MSELGFQHTAGSSGQGLTFVRPLPQESSAPATSEAESSSIPKSSLSLTDRLFPPRSIEDSGSLPPVTGVQLGHFLVEERIGRGGMGAVFRAMDTRLGRVVALKILSPEHCADAEAVQRFQNEARAAAKLDHENIARVYYIGEEFGLHFIAFEFVTGTNVRNFILQKGRLSPADSVNYTLQIAEALRHTAAANVVHRDIKPSNLIVSPTGRAKLVDLGLARQVNPDLSRDLTSAGTALGTFDYIAPEQALDARNVDVRSDIYSLGCTLYHMLTGVPPYPTGTMFEKVMNHHRATPPDPRERNPQVSPQLAHVVQKMMASNPDERYASPDSLINDLVLIAESLGLEPVPPESMIWSAPLFRRRSGRWDGARVWTGVALVLLLLVVLDRIRFDAPRQTNLPALTTSPVANDLREVPSETPGPASASADADDDGASVSNNEISTTEPITPPIASNLAPNAPPETQVGASSLASSANNEFLLNPEMSGPAVPAKVPTASAVSRSSIPAEDPGSQLNADQGDRSEPGVVSNETSTGPSSTPPPATPEPFVIIGPSGEERLYRSTLAAACAVAQDNWAIEIHADGPVAVQKETLNIIDKRLKIRPGRDYRPLLRFDLSDQLSMGSFSRVAEMIHVERGAVELYDLDVEMIVDPQIVADWTIVTLVNGSRLTAQGVSMTVVNAAQSQASLIYLPEGESSELGDLMPERMMSRQNTIELKECFARGEADFAVQDTADPVSFNLENTALALAGYGIRIDGTNTYLMMRDREASRLTSIALDHVTAVTGKGMLSASSGEHGSLPDIRMAIDDSVFRVMLPDYPFIEITGHEDYDLLREKLEIPTSREPSFFAITGPLVAIDSTTSLLPGPSRELGPEELTSGSRNLVEDNLLAIPSQVDLTKLHQILPAELELRPGDDNPAIGASGDLQNAGVNWRSPRLPVLRPKSGRMTNTPE